nr:MAG TPA: hypothetical protein [Bacteriophage sp.]
MPSVATISVVHITVCEDSDMFILNSARESLTLTLMRPRRNYTASLCSLFHYSKAIHRPQCNNLRR